MGRENPQTKRFLVQYKKCIHCGQLILRKIRKIGATRCQILRLKCTQFDFRWGSAPDPAGGAYSATPDPLAVFKGAYFEGEGGEGKGRGGPPEGLIRHWLSTLYCG